MSPKESTINLPVSAGHAAGKLELGVSAIAVDDVLDEDEVSEVLELVVDSEVDRDDEDNELELDDELELELKVSSELSGGPAE